MTERPIDVRRREFRHDIYLMVFSLLAVFVTMLVTFLSPSDHTAEVPAITDQFGVAVAGLFTGLVGIVAAALSAGPQWRHGLAIVRQHKFATILTASGASILSMYVLFSTVLGLSLAETLFYGSVGIPAGLTLFIFKIARDGLGEISDERFWEEKSKMLPTARGEVVVAILFGVITVIPLVLGAQALLSNVFWLYMLSIVVPVVVAVSCLTLTAAVRFFCDMNKINRRKMAWILMEVVFVCLLWILWASPIIILLRLY